MIPRKTWRIASAAAVAAGLAIAGCSSGGSGGGGGNGAGLFSGPTRSSSIAITSDDRRVVVANRETDTISVIRVRDDGGSDAFEKLAEVAVGDEPRNLALSPDDRTAWVANTASGTISVVPLEGPDAYRVAAVISVGAEPRGVAVTPNGSRVYVANHTEGTVSVIDAASRSVVSTVVVGGNPTAIAITNDGDADDLDETVFVSRFYAELIPGGPGEGFDDGKQGVVVAFGTGGSAPAPITLSPLSDSGFTADRAAFCSQFNPLVHSDIFCPDTSATDPLSDVIAKDPQGAYPNQLHALLIRNGLVYVPSIGASPEPPVKFNVNVQALVHAIDVTTLRELPAVTQNLNAEIKAEAIPGNPTASLDHLFGNDVVDIDASADGTRFLILSRGGNYALRATADANGRLDIGAAAGAVRFQTGNIPSGVVMSHDGRRAYANNEVNVSVTAMDLETNGVIARDVASGTPPEPGTFDHNVLVGKLAFVGSPGTELEFAL